MTRMENTPETLHVRVLTNQVNYYAVWSLVEPIPRGWWEIGKTGALEDCLAFIDALTPNHREDAKTKTIFEQLCPLRRTAWQKPWGSR